MSHIFIFELYPLCRGIGVLSCFFKVFSFCRHAEDTATVGHDLSVVEFCSGVKAIIAFMLFKLIQTFDRETFVIFHRISVGCEHYTDSSIVLKL